MSLTNPEIANSALGERDRNLIQLATPIQMACQQQIWMASGVIRLGM